MAAFMISCTRREEPDEDCVYVSDGEGNRGVFSVKEKKCSFKDSDIVVLYVKNNTENEYTVTVNGSFFTSDGKEASAGITKSKTIFSGLETCYIFHSSANFDKFNYKIESEKKDAPVGGRIKYENSVTVEISPYPVDEMEGAENVRAVVMFFFTVRNDFPDEMFLDGELILFDNRGDIFDIHEYHKSTEKGTGEYGIMFVLDGIFWEDDLELPENLKGPLDVAFDFEYEIFEG